MRYFIAILVVISIGVAAFGDVPHRLALLPGDTDIDWNKLGEIREWGKIRTSTLLKEIEDCQLITNLFTDLNFIPEKVLKVKVKVERILGHVRTSLSQSTTVNASNVYKALADENSHFRYWYRKYLGN